MILAFFKKGLMAQYMAARHAVNTTTHTTDRETLDKSSSIEKSKVKLFLPASLEGRCWRQESYGHNELKVRWCDLFFYFLLMMLISSSFAQFKVCDLQVSNILATVCHASYEGVSYHRKWDFLCELGLVWLAKPNIYISFFPSLKWTTHQEVFMWQQSCRSMVIKWCAIWVRLVPQMLIKDESVELK